MHHELPWCTNKEPRIIDPNTSTATDMVPERVTDTVPETVTTFQERLHACSLFFIDKYVQIADPLLGS